MEDRPSKWRISSKQLGVHNVTRHHPTRMCAHALHVKESNAQQQSFTSNLTRDGAVENVWYAIFQCDLICCIPTQVYSLKYSNAQKLVILSCECECYPVQKGKHTFTPFAHPLWDITICLTSSEISCHLGAIKSYQLLCLFVLNEP